MWWLKCLSSIFVTLRMFAKKFRLAFNSFTQTDSVWCLFLHAHKQNTLMRAASSYFIKILRKRLWCADVVWVCSTFTPKFAKNIFQNIVFQWQFDVRIYFGWVREGYGNGHTELNCVLNKQLRQKAKCIQIENRQREVEIAYASTMHMLPFIIW